MGRLLDIVTSTNNPFVALWGLFELGWDTLHWWFVVIMVIQAIVLFYLFEIARGDTFR